MSNDMLDGQLSIYSKPRWPSKPKTMFTDILIIVVCLGIFIGLMVIQRNTHINIKDKAYQSGHEAGYQMGLDELRGTLTNSIPVVKVSTE